MTSLWQQIRLIVWKNFLLKRKQPILLLIELAWPLSLVLILVYIRKRTPLVPTPSARVYPFAMPSAGYIPFAEHVICQRALVKSELDSEGFGMFNKTASYAFRKLAQDLGATRDINWTALSLFPKDLGAVATVLSNPAFYSNLSNTFGLSESSNAEFRTFLYYEGGLSNQSIDDFSHVNVNWNKLALLKVTDANHQTPIGRVCKLMTTRTAQLACLFSLQPAPSDNLLKSQLLSGTPFLMTLGTVDPMSLNAALCSPYLFSRIFRLPPGSNTTATQQALSRLPPAKQMEVVQKLIDLSTADFRIPASVLQSSVQRDALTRLPSEVRLLMSLLRKLQHTDTRPIVRFAHYLLLQPKPINAISAATVAFCSELDTKAPVLDTFLLIIKQLRATETERGGSAKPANDTRGEASTPDATGKHSKEKHSIKDHSGGNKSVPDAPKPAPHSNSNVQASVISAILRKFASGSVHFLFSPNTTLGHMIIDKALEPFKDLIEAMTTSAGAYQEMSLALATSLEELAIAAQSPAARSFLASPLCTYRLTATPVFIKFTCRLLNALQPGFSGEAGDEMLVVELARAMRASGHMAGSVKTALANVHLSDSVEGLTNETALADRAKSLAQKRKLAFAGVVFTNLPQNATELPRHVIYKIRQNTTIVPSTSSLHRSSWQPGLCLSVQDCISYQRFGFAFLQDMIDRAIIVLQANLSPAEALKLPGAWLQSFPYPCYLRDKFSESIARTLPLVMVLGWVLSVAILIKSLVYEKEERLKEVMKVMGMRSTAYWIAWFITSFTIMSFSAMLLIIILKLGHVLTHIDTFAFFFFLELFSISTIAFCFLVSTFFCHANLAACCGSLLFFAAYLPFTAISLQQTATAVQKGFSCLLAPSAFGLSTSYIVYYEEQGVGLDWTNMRESPIYNDSYNFVVCCTFLALDSIIYFALACYLDLVFPGKYGVSVKWNVPFQPSFWHIDLSWFSSWGFRSNAPQRLLNRSDSDVSTLQGFSATHTSIPADVSTELESEPEPTHLKCGVSIHNLVKEYHGQDCSKLAVNGLSVNFYEGQITSFLGHNGAGKTTSMSLLSGIYKPTSGTAYIYGKNIRTEMPTIRKSLGICPQHNVLFEKLTVEEHLRFYATMKGVPGKDIERQMESWLHEIGLMAKRDCRSQNLSGGMQRKLSVAIAFIGGSKTVLLDEPTAGVDPYARRCIWEMLIKYRNEGRTIILSTHFMDEADILGDRIAIVAHGKLRCVGSSMFLKSRFGTGYTLTLAKKKAEPTSPSTSAGSDTQSPSVGAPLMTVLEVLEVPSSACPAATPGSAHSIEWAPTFSGAIKRFVLGAVLLENIGDEVTYRLPLGAEQTAGFLELLHYLEYHLEELGIASFGVTDSTLEQVFIKVSAGLDELSSAGETQERRSLAMSLGRSISERSVSQDIDLSAAAAAAIAVNDATSPDEMLGHSQPRRHGQSIDTHVNVQPTNLKGGGRGSRKVTGIILMFQQFRALFAKRFHHYRRNKRGLASQLFLPPLLITLAMAVKHGQKTPSGEKPLLLVPSAYPGDKFVPIKAINASHPLATRQLRSLSAECGGIGPRQLWQTRHTDASMPACYATQSHRWTWKRVLRNPKSKLPKDCAKEQGSWAENAAGTIQQRTLDNDILLQNISKETDFGTFLIRTQVAYKWRRWGGITTGMKYQDASQNSSGHYVVDRLAISHAMKAWSNNNGYHSAPIYLNAMNNALLRAVLPDGESPSEYGISVMSHPFNKTALQLQEDYLKSGIDLLIAVAIIFAMAFVPTSFCVFLIAEKTSGTKGLLRLCGVSGFRYWIANYIWDMACYAIICNLCLLIILIFHEQVYLNEHTFPAVCLLFIMYGFSSTAWIYPASFFFKVPSTAYVFLLAANMFIGVFGTLTTFLLQIFSDKDIERANNVLRVLFLIFPNYCLGRGLMDLSFQYYKRLLAVTYGLDFGESMSPFGFGQEQIGRNLVAMACITVVFFLITLAMEFRLFQRVGARVGFGLAGIQNVQAGQSTVTDHDVVMEARCVKAGRCKNKSVVLDGLTKVYWKPLKSYRAVNNISLGVGRGECFGLLGINGAGKSTTFNMLTGLLDITSGDAYLNGHSIIHDRMHALKQIGYCPQFDALDDLLTTKEHLILYARLRGVPEGECDSVATWCIRRMQLATYSDKLAGSLSGGNKRKLSTAMAIIGKPKLIFLDEPTTGMDPGGRRFLWSVIIGLVRLGHCVILTSHSMEECEALCQRLSIMVNGEFCCMGSPQHLKDKFGTGYTITLRLKGRNPSLAPVKNFCATNFPSCTIQDEHHNMLQVQLSSETPLSEVFSILSCHRDMLGVEDFSVSQTTLDQVFVSFARNQSAENEDEATDDDLLFNGPRSSSDTDTLENTFADPDTIAAMPSVEYNANRETLLLMKPASTVC